MRRTARNSNRCGIKKCNKGVKKNVDKLSCCRLYCRYRGTKETLNTKSRKLQRKGKMEKKIITLAMAERLEKPAVSLDSLGMNKEAELNRAKAKEIRIANK